MRALLDVNVLIALHDRDHIHHEQAAAWLADHAEAGWASCPLTQNGCLRIMSQPGYGQPQPLPALVAMLRHSTQTPWHAFWPDDLSLLDTACFDDSHLLSGRPLTNLYLLALAVRHGGRLVTFDRRMPLAAVRGARAEHLVVL
jgi:toxin-antitoxin system PIN domain toxin